jgi:hypothetical protein
MKTIIGFDSWTQGAHHFERLVQAMEEEGYKLILIHVGSWGHDRNRPTEEMIGNLLVRDISYYKGLSFLQILKKENPSGVLILSMQAYLHRAFNRYCNYLSIPTMHLYHGLVNVQPASVEKMMPINWKSQFSIFCLRAVDNMTKVLPTYIKSLLKTKASWYEWGWFFRDIYRKFTGTTYYHESALDAMTTICCVYTASDIPHAIQRYRMPINKIKVVGNPDLILFGLKESMMGSYDFYDPLISNEVMYIDTAFIEAGVAYNDKNDFIDHLIETSDALKQQEYNLVIKLHPAHLFNGIHNSLKELNMNICEKEDFMTRLLKTSAAIVEPSSAALIPALMGIPILLGKYGRLNGLQFGDVLYSYPRAHILNDIHDIRSKIKETQKNPNTTLCLEWISKNIGPLPAENMPKRVMEVFKSIMQNS